MIDVLTEQLIDLKGAAAEKPLRNARTGKAAHVGTIFRYVLRGARDANGNRVRLEVVRTPSGLKTSREAIVRFIQHLTDPDAPLPQTVARRRQQMQAEAELKAAGFEMND
jgi:hypothetical protein